MLMIVFFTANFVTLPFYAWLPTFVSEKFHRNLAEAAFTATVYLQFSSCIGAILGGVVADSWRKRRRGGRIFTQLIGILCYAPFMYLLSGTESYIALILGLCCLGLFKGMYDANVWAAFYDLVPLSRRGTLCGLANTLAWVGGSISVFLVGYVVDAHWFTMSQTFQLFPILNILMGLLLFAAGRIVTRRSQ
jgi:sugar phosphate permease